MSDKCDRCGSVGTDRRTLWMACLYQMNELAIPFKERSVNGTMHDVESTEPFNFGGRNLGSKLNWGPTIGEPHRYHFYTLLVCKRCRADWMQAIGNWFEMKPTYPDDDADEIVPSTVGSGIFIRENGVTREITREEWDRRNPDREPFTAAPH